ncbi:hypothetical protein BDW71DRAFT_186748 [Aspergillus fruticulosus]
MVGDVWSIGATSLTILYMSLPCKRRLKLALDRIVCRLLSSSGSELGGLDESPRSRRETRDLLLQRG